jgi:hypothetical protein
MSNIFQRLANLFKPEAPVNPLRDTCGRRLEIVPCDPVPQWTADHQKAWVTFLGSPAGATLMMRLRQVAGRNALAGAQDMMHPAHSAGRAAGFYDALLWLDSQARIEFEQHIPISGADADQSATSMQPLTGEAALREHYSP